MTDSLTSLDAAAARLPSGASLSHQIAQLREHIGKLRRSLPLPTEYGYDEALAAEFEAAVAAVDRWVSEAERSSSDYLERSGHVAALQTEAAGSSKLDVPGPPSITQETASDHLESPKDLAASLRPLTLSESAEIAAFAEAYAEERFGLKVTVTVTHPKPASHGKFRWLQGIRRVPSTENQRAPEPLGWEIWLLIVAFMLTAGYVVLLAR